MKRTRVYKFYSSKWGRDALSKGRLKVSTQCDLNDPFEFAACDLGSNIDRKAHSLFIKKVFGEKHGLVSFTKDWSNPVLWSHYADNHTGIALGIDIISSQLKDVNYVADRTNIEFVKKVHTRDISYLDLLTRTKFDHWKYENEVRAFVKLDPEAKENGLYFIEFSDQIRLAEVIIGHKYESKTDIPLQVSLEKSGINFTTARPAFTSFQMVEQHNKLLRKKL